MQEFAGSGSRPSSTRVRWISGATSSSWQSCRSGAASGSCDHGAHFEAEGITQTFRHMPLEEIAAIYIRRSRKGSAPPDPVRRREERDGVRQISEYERKTGGCGRPGGVRWGAADRAHPGSVVRADRPRDWRGVPAGRLVVGHSDGIDDHEYSSIARRARRVRRGRPVRDLAHRPGLHSPRRFFTAATRLRVVRLASTAGRTAARRTAAP